MVKRLSPSEASHARPAYDLLWILTVSEDQNKTAAYLLDLTASLAAENCVLSSMLPIMANRVRVLFMGVTSRPADCLPCVAYAACFISLEVRLSSKLRCPSSR